MAEGEGSKEPEDSDATPTRNGDPKDRMTAPVARQDDERDEGDEEDEEEEPRLKYTPVTKRLSSLYRNGDAVSAFLVGGDKMVRRTTLEKRHSRVCN
jgi:vacuolar protein sorting-associated protein 41